MMNVVLQISKEVTSNSDQLLIKFVEPLTEYAHMLKSISNAISQQESKKKMFSKMLSDFVSDVSISFKGITHKY
jgi:hypothetical protein